MRRLTAIDVVSFMADGCTLERVDRFPVRPKYVLTGATRTFEVAESVIAELLATGKITGSLVPGGGATRDARYRLVNKKAGGGR